MTNLYGANAPTFTRYLVSGILSSGVVPKNLVHYKSAIELHRQKTAGCYSLLSHQISLGYGKERRYA